MRKLIQFGAMIAAGTGMLAAQWLNLPVERAEFRAEPLTVLKLESIGNAEKEIRQYQLDERAARAVLVPYGERCAALSFIAASNARRHNLPPRLVAGTIVAESSCNPSAVSKAGATGLMQVMPSVWRQYSRAELMNPEKNIAAGTEILGHYCGHAGSYRGGLRLYFGATAGSDEANIYADKVLAIAGRKN